MIDRLADRGLHLLGLPGLAQVAEDVPLVDGVDHRLDVGIAGEQQPGGVGPRPLDPAEEVHPAHVGHPLIGQDHGRIQAVHGVERLDRGDEGGDLVVLAEQVVERSQDVRLVVDDHQRRPRPVSAHGLEPPGTEIIPPRSRRPARTA